MQPPDARALTGRWISQSSGELELMARTESGRATMAVVRSGGVIADIPLLLDLQEGDVGERCVARLSHTTIAHLLGARWQSVTRVVRELRDGGLIQTGYGVVELLDLDGLAAVMGPDPLP